jgi:arginine deiminase
MHIDTLFTQISKDEFVIYENTLKSNLIKVTQFNKDGTSKEFSTLESFLLSANPAMKFILCVAMEFIHTMKENSGQMVAI